MFHESILGEKKGNLRGGDEEVIDAIDFAWSLLSCSMGYGETKCSCICLKLDSFDRAGISLTSTV